MISEFYPLYITAIILGLSILLKLSIAVLRELDIGAKIGILGIVSAIILAVLGPYIMLLPFYQAIILSVIIGIGSFIALFWPRNRSIGSHVQTNNEMINTISVPITRPNSAQQERYEKLAEHVFGPLSEFCTQLDTFRIDAPNDLALDDSRIGEIINFPYFREAKEHLKNDLEENIIQPEELHSKILRYNVEVELFLNVIIPCKTRREFEKIPNLEISEAQYELPNNAVILYTVIGNIKKYFLSDGKNDPELFYENGMLSEGHRNVILAIIQPELEAPVRHAISNLKHDYALTSVMDGTPIRNGIRRRRIELIDSGKKLSEFINNNILFAINS